MTPDVRWNPPAPRPAWDGRQWQAVRSWRYPMVVLMRIDRWNPRRDGPLSDTALKQKLEARGYQVSTWNWPAGSIIAGQARDREGVAAVASGLLKVTIDSESAILTAGDMVFVPSGAVRRIEVVGAASVHGVEGIAA